jgi:hypothetical protein
MERSQHAKSTRAASLAQTWSKTMDKRSAFKEAFVRDDIEHQSKILDRLHKKTLDVEK